MASSGMTQDPEQERLRKARLWESMVAAGTPPMLATTFVEAGHGMDPEPRQIPSPTAGIGRWVGLGARGVVDQLGGIAAAQAGGPLSAMAPAAVAPFARLLEQRMGLPGGEGAAAVQRGAQQVGNAMGLPQPQNGLERVASTAMGGAALGAPFGPAAAAGGLTGGATQQVAAEANLPPWMQALAALVGGYGGGKAVQAAQTRITRGGRMTKHLAEPYRRAGDDPVAGLQQAGAVARGNPELMGHEAMGRPGAQIAQRVAQEGGTAAEPLLQRVADQAEPLALQQANRMEALGKQARTTFSQRVRQVLQHPTATGGLDTEQALRDSYRPRIDKAYEDVRWKEIEVTPEMEAMLRDPTIQRHMAEARAGYNAGVEGAKGERTPRQPLPELWELDANGQIARDPDGNPLLKQRLPLAVFDETKKLLDRKLGEATMAEDRGSVTNALERIHAVIEDYVDPQTDGAYPAARELAGEYARRRAALAYGRDIRNVANRGQTRGQVPERRGGTGRDVVEARLSEMTPDERALARAGRIYTLLEKVRTSPEPWKALGDLAQHEPFFTPDQIGELRAAQRLGEQTAAGTFDQASQRIGDRAAGMESILQSAKPGPMQSQANKAKAIMVDIMIRANRSAIRDLQTADQSKILYRPTERRALAEGLSLQGDDFARWLAGFARRYQSIRQSPARGMVAGAATTPTREPER